MKTQSKVNITRMHNVLTGKLPISMTVESTGKTTKFEVPVAEGKIILLESNELIPNQIISISNRKQEWFTTGMEGGEVEGYYKDIVPIQYSEPKFVIANQNLIDYELSGKSTDKCIILKPIIISEMEKIEVGDYVFQNNFEKTNPQIIKIETQHQADIANDKTGSYSKYKILVLPEQFSSKHLQAIVDGKMKENDKVLVEYQAMVDVGKLYEDKPNEADFYRIKLNSEGHVTLHRDVEKMYTREELEEIATAWARYCRETDFLEAILFQEWFDQNVK
jgi:hypothetical protein